MNPFGFGKAALVFLSFWPGMDSPLPRVHYLGHASFLLTFKEGLSVLTDYGESNAYGLDSPVFSLGEVVPSIVTLSHDHPDHAGGVLPEGDLVVLRGGRSYESGGLVITPLPSFENDPDEPDNVAFLFEYGGWKILHLGDCQALMAALGSTENPDQIRHRIRTLYPDRYDLVLLPIGFTRPILSEAAAFASLLDARFVVPMHYWDPGDRDAFLELMDGRRTLGGGNFRTRREGGPALTLPSSPWEEEYAVVLGLQPGPLHPLVSKARQES